MATVADLGSPDYRIHHGEPCGAGIRRLAVGRVDAALERMAALGEDPGEAIHGTRKDIKRVRSALRLVRDAIGSDAFIRENALFRAAGYLLGPVRDAAIKIEVLDAQQPQLGIDADAARGWRDELRREHNERLVRLMDELADEVVALLETGRAGIYAWHVDEIDWADAERGHDWVRRRGQERLEAVFADPAPRTVHAWRRRAKDLRHHLEILRDTHPDRAGARLERARMLTDLLGDHHDLAVLGADAATREGLLGADGVNAVTKTLSARMAALAAEAIALARSLYDAPPAERP